MSNKINLIAEIGVNHNGNIETAKKMVLMAKKAQCDFVKFQLFRAENLVNKDTALANYQKKNSLNSETQYDMLKKLELTYDNIRLLKSFCDKKKIKFLCTAFDLEALNFLKKEIKLKQIKISSTDIDNYPMLFQAGRAFKKIFLSTGLASIQKIDLALKVLLLSNKFNRFENCIKHISSKKKINFSGIKKKVIIFQCTSSYPCNDNEVNLNVLETYKKRYGLDIGFSDHTIGIESAMASTGFGCRYIEKHFTLNKKQNGPDHSSSLDYKELKNLSFALKKISKSLGSFRKKPTISETKNKKAVKKTYYIKNKILKNSIISLNDLIFKRPFTNDNSKKIFKILGTKSKKLKKTNTIL